MEQQRSNEHVRAPSHRKDPPRGVGQCDQAALGLRDVLAAKHLEPTGCAAAHDTNGAANDAASFAEAKAAVSTAVADADAGELAITMGEPEADGKRSSLAAQ
eukprot:Skav202085  [mRNA]  locus=scaffold513:121856:123222:- [translate_table: standard]